MQRDQELDHLRELLQDAEYELRSPTMSDAFARHTRAELIDLISSARSAIAAGTLTRSAAAELWRIFAPTCDWDDVGGSVEIGNRIFDLIDTLYGPPPAAS